MVEAVGLALAILPLIDTAKGLYKSIQRLRANQQRRDRLNTLVNDLIHVLEKADWASSDATALVFSSLHEIESTLGSLAQPRRRGILNFVKECTSAPGDADRLDEAERKLVSLRIEVVVVANILQLKRSIYNERMELPQSPVGLDRAKPILEFLQTSGSEQLRVIGIHGLPGVGKTTLLSYIWKEASSEAPFAARAHIQFGEIQIGENDPTSRICSLQSRILQQLGGGDVRFTSPEGGRQKLSEHFQQLRGSTKPVFLAIDKVFEVEDLRKLLPFTLSKDLLPASSCIVVTCRNFAVIRALLNICHLSHKTHSQVLCFTPSCLNPEESKTVFLPRVVNCTSPKTHSCLTAWSHSARGCHLHSQYWESYLQGMREDKGRNGKSSRSRCMPCMETMKKPCLLTTTLRVSYDQLRESRKAAFLDLVNLFYGWPWERVERILGVSVLNDLKDSSLISEADGWAKCNQSALRVGFYSDEDSYEPSLRKVVTMHDLTLKFGESLPTLSVTTMRDYRSSRGLLQNLEASKLRNLFLWRRDPEADSELEFLEKTTSLQTLWLHDKTSDDIFSVRKPRLLKRKKILLKANAFPSRPDVAPTFSGDGLKPPHLRMLRLEGWKSSRIIMEMKLSCEIRELHLEECHDVEQLPDTPLSQLEWLSIKRCRSFQRFLPSCVKNWRNLKYLKLAGCNKIKSIPPELGRLALLKSVRFTGCGGLKTLPSFCNAQGPSHLYIGNCRGLQSLPIISCLLHRLQLHGIPIKELSPTIGNTLSLQALVISNCESLAELPEKLGQLTALRSLDVSGCKSLKGLPPAIGNASSLEELVLIGCKGLAELPEEVGQLTSLRRLDIRACKSLKGLPPAIGKASSLEALNLSECEGLAELPEEVGQLTSLRRLDVRACKSLKGLPPAIGKALSLEELVLNGCEGLAELPEEVGQLTSLRWLSLRWCQSLKGLPQAIGKAPSLESLDLSGCKGLAKLPEEVGQLTSLRWLGLHACKSLKGLPPAIGKAPSLESLNLSRCEGLAELPEEVGQLTSLWRLDVNGCKSLKGLPSAIGNASSLEELDLSECEGLAELPEEVGQLTSLRRLDIRACKSLNGLPPAIGKASSLEALNLSECEGLAELPEEVGQLNSLRWLNVSGCKSLKGLPPAVTSLPGLSITR